MTVSTLPVLDLAEGTAPPPPAAARARRARFVVLALAVVLGMGLSVAGWRLVSERATGAPSGPVLRIAFDQAAAVAAMTVDDRTQIIAEGTDAESRNAAIPFAGGANAPMRGFLLHASAPAAATALKCLTQAIYYEAATEPLAGRRAVAQVVLNRMRHPAYPKSVCGVVYQGAERSTGCQFSFTCDGSLLRQPMAGPWREAEGIARAALAGRVEPSVGTATFYHADYVLPRWAFELAKVNKLGRHLFYRFTGAGGRPGMFNGQYSAQESIPAFDIARLRARLLADGNADAAPAEFTPGLTVAPHVTDRHASADVGGRLDVTRPWRLTIPDPAESSSRYRALVSGAEAGAPPQGAAAAEIAQ